MSLLFDTNVVSEWTKPKPHPRFVHWIGSIDSDEAHLSVVTLAEVQRGIERLPQGRRREQLFGWLSTELIDLFAERIIGVDRSIAAEWARLMARCEAAGKPMGSMDGFLAATAAVHGLTLVTRNVGDFAASGIALLNPWTLNP